MNRTDLLRQLAELQRQVDHGTIMIDAQQRIIGSLTACGEDVREAENLLASFHEAQESRLGEMERLLDALDKIPLVESDAHS
jgi:hypothetical protein